MSLGCVVDIRAFSSAENGAGDPKLFPGLCSGAPKQTLKTTRRRKKQRSHRSSRKHAVGDCKGGKVRGSKCKQLTSDGSWRLVLSRSAPARSLTTECGTGPSPVQADCHCHNSPAQCQTLHDHKCQSVWLVDEVYIEILS